MRSPLTPAGSPSLCQEFISALPVQHVAISTLGAPFELETLCASDPLAAKLDQLQLDYGEGPSWQASASSAPVVLRDLRDPLTMSWPVVHEAIAAHAIRGAYAFPMAVGALRIGVVDLYTMLPDALTDENITTATTMARKTGLIVLRRAIDSRDDLAHDDPSSRRMVHQATGMVVAQLRIPPAEALMLLRAHAFAIGEPVTDVAAEVIARRLDFSD